MRDAKPVIPTIIAPPLLPFSTICLTNLEAGSLSQDSHAVVPCLGRTTYTERTVYGMNTEQCTLYILYHTHTHIHTHSKYSIFLAAKCPFTQPMYVYEQHGSGQPQTCNTIPLNDTLPAHSRHFCTLYDLFSLPRFCAFVGPSASRPSRPIRTAILIKPKKVGFRGCLLICTVQKCYLLFIQSALFLTLKHVQTKGMARHMQEGSNYPGNI